MVALIPGFPGRDFANSRDPGIFRDGISLKSYPGILPKKYGISWDFLLSAYIWPISYILEDREFEIIPGSRRSLVILQG